MTTLSHLFFFNEVSRRKTRSSQNLTVKPAIPFLGYILERVVSRDLQITGLSANPPVVYFQ